jgi:photosystem II stability/assembly factor-like uncharacterized protein
MAASVFISTTGSGLARAECGERGKWAVERLLSGVDLTCLAVDPANGARAYAGSRGHGVLRSDDKGRTWQTVGHPGSAVMAIAASPMQEDVVYAGTKPARLFVSGDAGTSWEELPGFRRIPGRRFWFSPAEKPFTAYVQAIALSPSDPYRLIAGIEFGATVMSTDGGKTWTGHRQGSLRDCHNLTYHVANGDWVYEAGGTGSGVAVSRDGGSTWTQPGQGMDRHYGWAVAGDPSDPATFYVSVSPGPTKAHGDKDAQAHIYRYDGRALRALAGGLPQPVAHMPYALLTDGAIPGFIVAGLSNGELWQSFDRGDNWAQLPVRLPGIRRSLVLL